MSNLTEIIQQIKHDLSCPICRKSYELGEIRLRGLFDRTLVVQTICSNGHMTIFMTSFQRAPQKPPLSSNEIIDLHKALANFDGDFEKIWNK